MKGKVIPFKNSRFGDADITPQKVKGAVFSILGERLDGLVFIDLYSGSGQIGIEALSRGCDLVIFNEFDRQRYSFIREFLDKCCCSEQYILLNMKAGSAMKNLTERNISADIIFLDPPYDKKKADSELYRMLLESLSLPGIAGINSVVIIQHFNKNILPDKAGRFTKRFTRGYGSTSLSVYDSAADPGDGNIRQG
jgi:16S rRNA (guanine966-N2)-methyltransferase